MLACVHQRVWGQTNITAGMTQLAVVTLALKLPVTPRVRVATFRFPARSRFFKLAAMKTARCCR
jgi:hypothetical protein